MDFLLLRSVRTAFGAHPGIPGVKRAWREGNYSPPSSAEINCVTLLPIDTASWRVAWLIKHKYNLIFLLLKR